MKIAIGSDHGGYNLKEAVKKHLSEKGVEFNDMGAYSTDSCDYPDYAVKTAQAVALGEYDKGILICGTGIGISIAANKVKGIRAALCGDTFSARMSREHNDSNILCMGERVVGIGLAMDIVDEWLNGVFAGGRHMNRVQKIADIEKM
ncbi:MAG: ribose 5-phosphate isomerase B [Ignavibacteriales bacterium]